MIMINVSKKEKMKRWMDCGNSQSSSFGTTNDITISFIEKKKLNPKKNKSKKNISCEKENRKITKSWPKASPPHTSSPQPR